MISPRVRKNSHHKALKYEFEKRRDKWKRINEPLETLLMIPPEGQSEFVQELVSETCYLHLAEMLGLPQKSVSIKGNESTETVIPFIPSDEDCLMTIPRISPTRPSKTASEETVSYSGGSSLFDIGQFSVRSHKPSEGTLEGITAKTECETFEVHTDFVEVEKKIAQNHDQMLKHKAILRFLDLPEAEAATWRVKETKNVNDLSQMTLEEQGDFLINKIAVDFCDWLRKLGGDEKSFINEEILKELFQVGMDNPASRAICVEMKEKRVLYQKLAELLQVPKKSFHEVLTTHLNWDVRVEKRPSKMLAFQKALPNDQKFKTPKNRTAETWLEWNKMDPAQLSFADVYGPIKELRSTKEYCKWLVGHPEYERPQYLVDQGMFHRASGPMGPPKESHGRTSTQWSIYSHFFSRKSSFKPGTMQHIKSQHDMQH